MKRCLVRLLGVSLFLTTACSIEPPMVRGGSIHWNDGPDVQLNAANLARINEEIALILKKEYSYGGYRVTVTSPGKRVVQYDQSGKTMPDPVWNEVTSYVDKRAMELAAQQLDEDGKGNPKRSGG